MEYRIAVLPGDHVGPEVMKEGIKVLQRVGELYDLQFTLREGLVGGAAIDATGDPLPQATLDLINDSDAVLFGSVGGPEWDDIESDKRPERGLLRLRQSLDLYANLRPAKLYSALVDASSLKREVVEGIDLLVVRELVSGIYYGTPRGIEPIDQGERGTNTMIYTSAEIQRVARLAFELAQKRRGKLTSADKANVLEVSVLWRREVSELAGEFGGVEVEHLYVDNCAMQLVRAPKQFDVIVCGNLFGDILSDEAAMLTGSIGMLPSASIGGKIGVFEPVHGSAPDISGQGVVNPIAMINSAAMMLQYGLDQPEAAQAIETAVETVLNQGYRTGDIMREGCTQVGTVEMGDRICAALQG
ncbi:MAG: 3-isopropylmalate dehydrogenase [Candidatus Entotheonella factor]|uniref:3-isopropylmalate dehydrogenase n=1 Tax=Entotheonella factor TaxID=1429438 RepID=W4LPR8_ENTF1|nr:3-isopropylmalate dehydrogenase [Candidatus Entotheonella palauensis]ETW99834.1 MAG: 3-isopropylmalate dehydrogenase [Candidatus Entotheonella factor]